MFEVTAYNRPEPSYRQDLTHVGKGTPMGELLRRYWQPVALSEQATSTPRKVRALGEDLILFRDGQGRAGLVHDRCCHRGTTLYYGRGEEDGIRCCYHGWKFDVEGRCIDMPMEPNNGVGIREKVRQPWYPVEERYGLVFAYMGPPELKPLLPKFEILEDLGEDEMVRANDANLGSGGVGIAPCNWLQHFENVVDPFHVPVLHDSFSGTQFVAPMGIIPDVEFEYTERGVRSLQKRTMDDGAQLLRITECLMPNVRAVASPRLVQGPAHGVGFVLPIDDTHYLVYNVARVKKGTPMPSVGALPGGRKWQDLTEEEHQRFPGDWEAQAGQGAITLHSEEHLVSSDKGIALLRRFLKKQADAVANGENPVGWTQTPGEELVRTEAGNYITPAE